MKNVWVKAIFSYWIFAEINPCSPDPCINVPNANATCKALSATSHECIYTCTENYLPIGDDASNGCSGIYCNSQLIN